MNLAEILAHLCTSGVITEAERDFLLRATATRGKTKGRVRSSKPSGKTTTDTDVGVWRSTMSSCAPSRAGMWALLLASEEERAAFDAAEALWRRICSGQANVRTLLGIAEPYRFNTVAHSYMCEREDILAVLDQMVAWDRQRRARVASE